MSKEKELILKLKDENPDLNFEELENAIRNAKEVTEKKEESERAVWLTPTKFAVIGIITAILLAILSNFVLIPWWQTRTAHDILKNQSTQSGELRAYNTELLTFTGDKVENVNIEQKALGRDGKVSSPAGFYFSNGKAGDKKVVDIYVDFSSQRSRDFLIFNRNTLKGLVDNGTIDLRIHPVPTGNAFTMYAAEAIAESFYTDPDKSWNFMLNLLRESVGFSSDKNEDYLNFVAKVAKDSKVSQVDAESIKNGTFSSWLVSVSNDERLKAGFYPPLIYIDNRIVDTSKVSVNDSEIFRKEVLR